MTSPKTSPWNCRAAALPIRTGCAPRYPGSVVDSYSGSERSPAIPYMIWMSAGSPAIARSSQSRHSAASAWKPCSSSACRVSAASRSQT